MSRAETQEVESKDNWNQQRRCLGQKPGCPRPASVCVKAPDVAINTSGRASCAFVVSAKCCASHIGACLQGKAAS